MQVTVVIDPRDGDGEWQITKEFELSYIPSIGAMIRTTKVGEYLEVTDVFLTLDANTCVVYAGTDVEQARWYFRDDDGWQIVNDPSGRGAKELSRPP